MAIIFLMDGAITITTAVDLASFVLELHLYIKVKSEMSQSVIC